MTIEIPSGEELADNDVKLSVCAGFDGMQIYLIGLMALGLIAVTLILFIDNL